MLFDVFSPINIEEIKKTKYKHTNILPDIYIVVKLFSQYGNV